MDYIILKINIRAKMSVIILFISLLSIFSLLVWRETYAQDIIVSREGNLYYAHIDSRKYRCSVGESGPNVNKIEGDRTTPIGDFPLREVFFRADKIVPTLVKTKLPIKKLTLTDGWCDAPEHPMYNKFVDLTNFDLNANHEKLYRDDDIYDIIIAVGYNDQPVIPGKGSTIFIHIAKEGYTGTAGCIAFTKPDLLEILPKLDRKSRLIIRQ